MQESLPSMSTSASSPLSPRRTTDHSKSRIKHVHGRCLAREEETEGDEDGRTLMKSSLGSESTYKPFQIELSRPAAISSAEERG